MWDKNPLNKDKQSMTSSIKNWHVLKIKKTVLADVACSQVLIGWRIQEDET